MEEKNIIEVRHLTKRFKSLVAVDDVSFAVREGEIFGFLGPNGAGKTTTLRMITNFITPNEGSITIGEKQIETEADEINPKIKNTLFITTSF